MLECLLVMCFCKVGIKFVGAFFKCVSCFQHAGARRGDNVDPRRSAVDTESCVKHCFCRSHIYFFLAAVFLVVKLQWCFSPFSFITVIFSLILLACPNYPSPRSSDFQPLEGLCSPAACWVILAGPYLTPDTSAVHGEELTALFISHRTALLLEIQVVAWHEV